MNLEGQLRRIIEIDEQIRNRNTGDPSELAKKMNISVSQLYLILKTMRKMGGTIKYSPELRSYYYMTRIKFIYGYVPESESRRNHQNIIYQSY